MISKHITHYLSSEGETYFTGWLKRLKSAQFNTKGFNNILLGKEIDENNAWHLILQFDDEQGVHNWSDNPIHEQLLKQLQPYLSRSSQIRFFKFETL